MRIIIDMQGMQTAASAHRGVGRYTENLVKSILSQNDKHEIYLALNGDLIESVTVIRNKFENLINSEFIVLWFTGYNTSYSSQKNKEMIDAAEIVREVFLNSFNPDVIFSTNLQEGLNESAITSVKKIGSKAIYCSTLHDVTPYFYKDYYLGDVTTKDWYYSKIKHAVQSDILLTVSNSSKYDIINTLDIEPDKVYVISNAYDKDRFKKILINKTIKISILKKYNINKEFIFYYGGNDKHKNIEALIHSYSVMPKELRNEYVLVLGGKEFLKDIHLKQLVESLNLTNNIFFPGFIDDNDLPILLNLCSAFVFPSTSEGFGLPVLEAMACGTPVIGSNASSIKEIINYAPALFDPMDIGDIADKIEKVLTEESYKRKIIRNAATQIKKYSWNESAKQLLELFGKLSSENFSKIEEDIGGVDIAIYEISKIKTSFDNYELAQISHALSENFSIQREEKIYLDVSSIIVHDHKSGIQRVTRAIASELLRLKLKDKKVELVYTRVGDSKFYRATDYMRQITGESSEWAVADDEIVDFQQCDILLFLDLHPGVAISHQNEIRYLQNKGVKVYFVVYDLLPVLNPETFWPEICAEFLAWVDVVSISDGAICISKSVANELKTYLTNYGNKSLNQFKIGYFHLGADISNSVPSKGMPSDALKKLYIFKQRPTFLMVGTLEPRKGYKQVLAAFEKLWADKVDVNLVFIGRMGWGMGDFNEILLNHNEYNKRLFWLHGITDEYLQQVYGSSSCLIAASEAEGFGLPLVEAAQRMKPIIARDIPVFKEVAGKSAYYFENSKDPLIITSAILEWLKLMPNNQFPKSDNLPWITWKDSAQQLLDVMLKDEWLETFQINGSLQPSREYDVYTQRLTWNNFHIPENGFRWSEGNSTSINFQWGSDTKSAQLRLRCTTLGTQKILIYLNEKLVFDQIVKLSSEFLIFNLVGLKKGNNNLSFEFPEALNPEPSDRRVLALAIYSLQIIALQPLVFGVTENHRSKNLEWSNFHTPEDTLRWTSGSESFITFNCNDVKLSQLEVNCSTLGKQKVIISLNDSLIYEDYLNGDKLHLTCLLNNLIHGHNILKISLPNARSPGGADQRLLAISIHDFKISEYVGSPQLIQEVNVGSKASVPLKKGLEFLRKYKIID